MTEQEIRTLRHTLEAARILDALKREVLLSIGGDMIASDVMQQQQQGKDQKKKPA